MTGGGIVVGYDGSPGSADALAWAAREALARRTELTVCLAQAPPYPAPTAEVAVPVGSARRGGEQALAPGMRIAHDLMGEGVVRPLLTAGPPTSVLCDCSATADMVVVGSRGRGGLPGMPIGSVSLQVAAHGHGRIVVVPGGWHPTRGQLPRPVVVGTEGSPGSDAAVTFAFEEAALRETSLLAVCALADAPGVLGGARQIKNDFEQLIARREQDYPDVAVHRYVSEGSARDALLEAAADAEMLVVGARGRGGLPGMPLGSISIAIVGYAACPVGVAHADEQDRGDQRELP